MDAIFDTGFEDLVPNPDEDHCHALINGLVDIDTAIAVLVNAILELA